MASTSTSVGTTAALLAAVQQAVDLTRNFKNEQINLYVSTDPTTIVTDAQGNPVTVPTWQHALSQVSQNALDLSGINAHLSTHDGQLVTLQGQIAALGTGGGGSVNYDSGIDSLTVPFALIPYGHEAEWNNLTDTTEAVVDAAGMIVTSNASDADLAANAGGVQTVFPQSLFRAVAKLPSTGKWWFVVKFDTTSTGTLDLVFMKDELAIAKGTNWSGDATNDPQVDLFFDATGVHAAHGTNGTIVSELFGVGNTQPVTLVCVDIDAGTVTVYSQALSAGTTVTVPPLYGASALAGATIGGYLYPNTTNFSATFDVTGDIVSPVVVPAGYQPLSELAIPTGGTAAPAPAGSSLIEWDARAAEANIPLQALPYGFRDEMTYGIQNETLDATVDSSGLVVSSVNEYNSALFRYAGNLPSGGMQWFLLDTNFGTTSHQQLNLSFTTNYKDFVLNGIGNGAASPNTLVYMQLRDGALTLAVHDTTNWTLTGSGLKDASGYDIPPGGYLAADAKILVVIDNGAGTISFYDPLNAAGNGGLLGVAAYTPPAPDGGGGFPPLGGGGGPLPGPLTMIGELIGITGGTVTKVTHVIDRAVYDAAGYIALPSGVDPDSGDPIDADPATLYSSPYPDGTKVGTMLLSSTAGSHECEPIKDGEIYVLTSSGPIPVPRWDLIGKLAEDNIWGGANSFGERIRMLTYGSGETRGDVYANILMVTPRSVFIGQDDSTTTPDYGDDSIVVGAGTLSDFIGQARGATYYGSVSSNSIVGYNAMTQLADGAFNVAVGEGVGSSLVSGYDNVMLGSAMTTMDGFNFREGVFIGSKAGSLNVYRSNTTWRDWSTSQALIAIGQETMAYAQPSKVDYSYAIGIGYQAMNSYTPSADRDIAIGFQAMYVAHTAGFNTAVGPSAMNGATMTSGNTALGQEAMYAATLGASNTAIGASTMRTLAGSYSLSTALGANATVTGSNQVQLGDSSTTTYAYGAVQNRSDERDKTEIRPTVLGLDFINAVEAVDFKWDMREDYIDHASYPQEPALPRPAPVEPLDTKAVDYVARHNAWQVDYAQWQTEVSNYQSAVATWKAAVAAWQDANSMAKLVHTGAHTRNRFHHGVIAQRLKATMDKLGVDFGGYQDHSLEGGQDVKSVGYEEFIAPLIKSVQELSAMVNDLKAQNTDLQSRVATLEGKSA